MRLLSAADVQETLCIKKSQFYQMIRQRKFPSGHGNAKLKRWLDIEVDFFLALFCGHPLPENTFVKQLSAERLAEIQACAEKARCK